MKQIIYKENDESNYVYFLIKGEVNVLNLKYYF